jgi:uncharacterized membrane protein AbrB (regulator of aidB expression)
MAMSLHYDPTYVAIHHLCRIFGLIVALPLLLRFFAARKSSIMPLAREDAQREAHK